MGYYDEAILAHHGILGQKWGVRRFESANGHLTAAGKKRYGDGPVRKAAQSLKDDRARRAKEEAQSAHASYNKKVAKIDEEAAKKKETLRKNYEGYLNAMDRKAEDRQKKADDYREGKTGLTDKQKKMIIAGAAVAGTALAAYGGYKLSQLNKQATEGLSNKYESVAKKAFFDKNELSATAQKFRMQSEFAKQNTDISKPGYKSAYEIAKDSSKYFDSQSKMMGEVAQGLRNKSQNKDFSVKEKVDYLKDQKNGSKVDVKKELDKAINSYNISKSAQTTSANKTASEASKLAKSVIAEGPKSFSSRQSSPISTINAGKSVVNNTTKIHGQTKFSQAAKANDDLVSDLLKKNAAALAGF